MRVSWNEDCIWQDHYLWVGRTKKAVEGRRGRAFLQELLAALDAMPEKRLAYGAFVDAEGCNCPLGVVARARGIDPETLPVVDDDEWDSLSAADFRGIADVFGVARSLVTLIMSENDRYCHQETPEQRWARMRRTVAEWLEEGFSA